MSATQVDTTHANAQALIALAQLFDRIENSTTAPDPAQYQTVVARLARALAEPVAAPVLEAVLARHRGAAELYENLHYAQAGLSRAVLERSIDSELLASQALARIALSSRSSIPRPDRATP